jgi:hypothetical protein
MMRVIVTVRAEGALARLAHDIRVEARDGSCTLEGDTVRARFPVAGLFVEATSRHGKNAFDSPSADDAREIEHRMRTVALAGGDAIEIVATRGRIEVIAPHGKQTVSPRNLDVRREGDRTIVRGACTLSLAALGTGKIQVPLGAVGVSDAIDVDFVVTITSAGPTTT